MRTPHPKNLEFGKLAQLLGSSYDQLGTLGRKRSVKSRAAKEVGSEGKEDNGSNRKGGVLTVWSVSGGRTITRSMVFITTRQSSFRTRFRTVFSHTVAKSVRLQIQAIGEARGKSGMPDPPEAPLSDGLSFTFLSGCYTHLPSRKSIRGRSTLSAS